MCDCIRHMALQWVSGAWWAPHGMSLPSETRHRISRSDLKVSGSLRGKWGSNFNFHLCLHVHLGL